MTDPELALNLSVVRDYHERVWVHDDLTALEDSWDPSAEVSVTGFADSTIAALRRDVERYRGAFTDVRSEIVHLIGQGAEVVLHWRTTGRHVGRYGSIAATDRDITMTGVDIFRLVGGRIVACDSLWDGLSVYEQMGVLTAPEQHLRRRDEEDRVREQIGLDYPAA